jgi:hypothetical protein
MCNLHPEFLGLSTFQQPGSAQWGWPAVLRRHEFSPSADTKFSLSAAFSSGQGEKLVRLVALLMALERLGRRQDGLQKSMRVNPLLNGINH